MIDNNNIGSVINKHGIPIIVNAATKVKIVQTIIENNRTGLDCRNFITSMLLTLRGIFLDSHIRLTSSYDNEYH